jgi:outer membrane receptor protein involved in Fe transport
VSGEIQGRRAAACGGWLAQIRTILRPFTAPFLLVIGVWLTFAVGPASAQEGVTSYPGAFFAANQPATAYEMVGLLPGFQIKLGDANVRGFSGTVGNVLIDGQLPTSKAETVEDILRRIAASSVERVELIRGAADMHGYPMLANVVRNKSETLRGRAELQGAITHYGTTEDKVAVHLTRQGQISTAELSASWDREIGSNNQNGFGSRGRFLPDGTPLQLVDYDFPLLTNNTEISSAYRQPLLGGDLAVGLALKQQRAYSNVQEHIYYPSIALATGLENKQTRTGEARLDYQHPLGDFGQLQLFAVHRLTEQDESSRKSNGAGTDLSRGFFNQREDVARLAWQREGALKLETGVEGAINVLSSRSTLALAGVPVNLPAANIRLEEKRVELFSTATWRISPVLMSELGARYETSNLTQSGDSSLTKDLAFFKPRWLTSWNVVPGHELRLLMERQVGQLVFRDFASSTSLNSNTVTGGNKNLEPARSWNISLAWEYHFWKRASLVVEAKREFISKVVDRIPVFSGTQVFNAVGNIGNGVRDGVQTNVILPLDELGLTGVTVSGDAAWHHSKVRDPATGMFRQITGGQTVSMPQPNFTTTMQGTYDIPSQNLRLGVDLHTHANSHESEYRIDEIDPTRHGFKLGVFAEYKPVPDWNVRVFARDIAQTAAYRDRYVYAGLRGTAPLSFVEYRKLNNGSVMGIDVQHDF